MIALPASALSDTEIRTHITTFLHDRFEIPESRMVEDAPLRDLGLDSILLLDVMLDIEDRFGIKLSDLSLPSQPRISDFVQLIRRHLRTKADGA